MDRSKTSMTYLMDKSSTKLFTGKGQQEKNEVPGSGFSSGRTYGCQHGRITFLVLFFESQFSCFSIILLLVIIHVLLQHNTKDLLHIVSNSFLNKQFYTTNMLTNSMIEINTNVERFQV